ncbi:Hyccin [Aphelenchoides avenae]|nr:Hyccin [Aphelenchus avenae]
MIAENRFMVLTRLLRSVNSLLSQMTTDVVCRSICQTLMNVCRSGFATSESSFRRKILGEEASEEVFPDRGKKARVPVAPHFLIEALNAVNFALFNGQADMGLRALDAVHQRAQHDLLADVLLETNAIRESLLDSRSQQMMRDSISYTRPSA